MKIKIISFLFASIFAFSSLFVNIVKKKSLLKREKLGKRTVRIVIKN